MFAISSYSSMLQKLNYRFSNSIKHCISIIPLTLGVLENQSNRTLQTPYPYYSISSTEDRDYEDAKNACRSRFENECLINQCSLASIRDCNSSCTVSSFSLLCCIQLHLFLRTKALCVLQSVRASATLASHAVSRRDALLILVCCTRCLTQSHCLHSCPATTQIRTRRCSSSAAATASAAG